MKFCQISIAKLMVVVAVAAANIAYLRWYGVEGTLLGTRLMALVLQASLLCAIFTRATARRFWVGFLTFGAVALFCLFEAIKWEWTSDFLDERFRGAMNAVLRHLPLGGKSQISMPDPSHKALGEVLMTIPQVIVAVIGGVLVLVVPESYEFWTSLTRRTRAETTGSGEV